VGNVRSFRELVAEIEGDTEGVCSDKHLATCKKVARAFPLMLKALVDLDIQAKKREHLEEWDQGRKKKPGWYYAL